MKSCCDWNTARNSSPPWQQTVTWRLAMAGAGRKASGSSLSQLADYSTKPCERSSCERRWVAIRHYRQQRRPYTAGIRSVLQILHMQLVRRIACQLDRGCAYQRMMMMLCPARRGPGITGPRAAMSSRRAMLQDQIPSCAMRLAGSLWAVAGVGRAWLPLHHKNQGRREKQRSHKHCWSNTTHQRQHQLPLLP